MILSRASQTFFIKMLSSCIETQFTLKYVPAFGLLAGAWFLMVPSS